jgi:hypothetical protein
MGAYQLFGLLYAGQYAVGIYAFAGGIIMP